MNRPAPSASIVHVMRMSALLLLTAWGQMMLYSPSLRHSLPTSSRTTRLRLVDMDMARCKRPSSRVKELPSLATDSSCLILVRTSIIRKEKRQSENPSLAIRRRNEAGYPLLSNTPSSARVAGTKLPHWQRKLRGSRVVLVSKAKLVAWVDSGRESTYTASAACCRRQLLPDEFLSKERSNEQVSMSPRDRGQRGCTHAPVRTITLHLPSILFDTSAGPWVCEACCPSSSASLAGSCPD